MEESNADKKDHRTETNRDKRGGRVEKKESGQARGERSSFLDSMIRRWIWIVPAKAQDFEATIK
jgi:hypothetical protein